MSQQLADNFLPTTTGYDLGSPTQEWDAYIQDFTCSGTALFSGTLAITSLEGIPFADQQTGATVTNKIDTGLATATNVVVLVPSTMGAGNATAIAAGKSILDLRGGLPKWFTNVSVSAPAWQLTDTGITKMTAMASDSASIASAGQIRLAHGDTIKIRNNGDTADITLASMSINTLVLGGTGGCTMNGRLVIAGSLAGVTTFDLSGAMTTSAQIISTLATGTAPLSITSTTVVPNLNVATLNGVTVSGAASAGKILTASSASAATWSSPTGGTTVILNKQDAGAAITGDSTDKTVFTYSMPSGTLAAGKGVRITFASSHTSGSASVLYGILFGATGVATLTATAGPQTLHSIVFNNTGSTTAQWSTGYAIEGATIPVASHGSPAENTNSGSPIVIKGTFNVANTDQVTPKGWLVELIT